LELGEKTWPLCRKFIKLPLGRTEELGRRDFIGPGQQTRKWRILK